jgi:hypothetical protein
MLMVDDERTHYYHLQIKICLSMAAATTTLCVANELRATAVAQLLILN